jgi:arylsulfatase I/J
VLLVVDDWGYANVGYHRRQGLPHDDVDTPNFNALIKQGLELDRNYVHKFCSPTRSSIQSGRLPVHVNLVNGDPTISNKNDPISGWAGIPRNMTGMAQLLKNAQYRTHLVGKWDCGMATPDHTPRGRGYDSSFGYFHHANDYWVEAIGSCPSPGRGEAGGETDGKNKNTTNVIDLWMADDGGGEHGASAAGNPNCVFCNGSSPPGVDPAQYKPMHNGPTLLGVNGTIEDYEEWKFSQYAMRTIRDHNATDKEHPLFLNYNMHCVHEPLQSPHSYFAAQEVLTNATYPDAPAQPRAIYHSMVKFADDVLGNLTAALKSNHHMWEDTLIVITSDNGGPMYGTNAANNFPLKGYKFSSWEGGIRVIGAVGGGFLDPNNAKGGHRRPLGGKLIGMIHGTDWYATFAALGGVSSADPRAEAAGLPPPDSLNLWPYLSGAVETSPRTSFQVDEQCLVNSPYKLLLGHQKGACWSGPHVPNATGAGICTRVAQCYEGGCLFDLFADPEERVDLAKNPKFAATLAAMQAQLAEANLRIFSPNRGEPDPRACAQVVKNGGYWGPFSL